MIHSLRHFLKHLEKNNRLQVIHAEVDPELEITEIINRFYQKSVQDPLSQVPVFLFKNVKGSKYPLVINVLGMEQSIEALLGQTPETVGNKIYQAALGLKRSVPKGKLLSWLWDHKGMALKAMSARTVRVNRAPFKKIKKVGAEINLNAFPIMKCWPQDGGKFITSGLVLTKSPKTGERNLGVYRLQILSRDKIIMHWQIQKGGGFHYSESLKLNQPLEVAVIIGADPLLWLAGVMPLPEGMDEISFSGFLRGASTPMISCETIGLDVPAGSEIVIEGVVHPGSTAMEGPFGDHFGHYSHPASFPVLNVQCITHREDAFYHSAVVGKPPQEDRAMGESISKIFLPLVKFIRPELVDLWAYYEAGFHNLLVASVKQRYEKEAIKTSLSLLGEGQLSLSKCVILVDPEVNVRHFPSVLEAIRRYFDPRTDFVLLQGTSQDTLDFTGPKMNQGSKMILDATGKHEKSESQGAPPELAGADWVENVKKADSNILDAKIFQETLMAVRIKQQKDYSEAGRVILKKLLGGKNFQHIKIMVVVSEDVSLENEVSLLWGIFTRFDCERDVLFSDTRLDGIRILHSGPMGIDASWKKGYPDPVEMREEVIEKVTERWKEYGFN